MLIHFVVDDPLDTTLALSQPNLIAGLYQPSVPVAYSPLRCSATSVALNKLVFEFCLLAIVEIVSRYYVFILSLIQFWRV